jgi:hypothetical protein
VPNRDADGLARGVRMLAGQSLSISAIDAHITDMETK